MAQFHGPREPEGSLVIRNRLLAVPLATIVATTCLAAPQVAAASQARVVKTAVPAASVKFTRKTYLEYARRTADATWNRRDELIATWRKTFEPDNPFGYRAPGGLIEMAGIYAALFELEHNQVYADRAKEVLLTYGDYRSQYPEAAAKKRPDYLNGVPALSDFFVVMRYLRAYDTLHRLGQLTPAQATAIEKLAAHSVDYTIQTSEWGAMNRAALRAETLAWAVRTMPKHPRAAEWEMQRKAIGDDNWGHWEIEDATIYHGIWLYSLIGYADAQASLPALFRTPTMFYYCQYFLNLLSPAAVVPDFGDAWWTSNWAYFLVFFETAAAQLQDPQLKWAAQQVAARYIDLEHADSPGMGYFMLDASLRGRDDIAPMEPKTLSGEVMEDVQGKKVVFRNGWKPDSSYLLLTYRDEGDGGLNFRDYLRDTIPVEEEKMTHGHADENSIPLLMSGGSMLLHDAGYRDYMPSGPYGAFRQDYFHNRLVVRPQKLYVGQKDGEERFSQHGALPGQGLLDFFRDSGAYRPIRTKKVDFISFADFDYSRTRLFDDNWGYDADRVVVYVKDPEMFVVFDVLKARVDEYFTLASLWHTRQVYAKGPGWYDTGYDTIGKEAQPDAKRLLVLFPQTTFRLEGVEPLTRHQQPEQTIYQAIGRHFEPGQTEAFVTVLVPHAKNADVAALARQVSIVKGVPSDGGLAVSIQAGARRIMVGTKLDLRRDIAQDLRRPRYLYEKGRVGYGPFETDGDLFFTTEQNGTLDYTVVNMTRAQWGGRQIFQVEPSFHGLAFDGSPESSGLSKVRYWRSTVKLDAAK